MSKSVLAFGICFLLICSVFIPISLGFNVKVSKIEQPTIIGNGNTLYVGGSGPDNYSTIKSAINDAVDGDTIYVYSDSSPYKELVVVDKSINLIGEDRDTTVIDGDYKGTVVDIQTNGVMVGGFTLINCNRINDWQYNVIKIIGYNNVVVKNNIISIGPWDLFPQWVAGVYLKDSSNNLIQENIIFDHNDEGSTAGIWIHDGSTLNNVSGNEVYGYSHSISISSNDNEIYNNNIHHNGRGISNYGDGNNIINNIVNSNPSEGISNNGASNTLISGNTITYNGDGGEFDNGLALVQGSNNHVINNHISNNNPTGVFLLVTERNYITDNHISDNKVGLYSDYGFKSVISRNNFIGNPSNAYFKTHSFLFFHNRWNKNYWDDYKGEGLYIIQGRIYFLIFFSLSWFNIDWNPAKEPYDI